MSNQYKIELHLATTYGKNSDQEIWNLLSRLQDICEQYTCQVNAMLLYKGFNISGQWIRFASNKSEFEFLQEIEKSRKKRELEEVISKAEAVILEAKRKLNEDNV